MWAFGVLLVITVLSQNSTPSLGQLGAYYFETLNQSQIWINLEPQGSMPGPNPIRLNITVAFTGLRLDRAPDVVEVRAESVAGTFPTTIRQPILRFQLGGGTAMDLTAPDKTFHFIARCPDCPADTVIARMPLDALRSIAHSSTVGIDALGFGAHLKPADLQSLRKFIDVVGNGVRIRCGVAFSFSCPLSRICGSIPVPVMRQE
jgi:hypothetical protein